MTMSVDLHCDAKKAEGQLMLPRTCKVVDGHLKSYAFVQHTGHLILTLEG
jgi:hypothetical protein